MRTSTRQIPRWALAGLALTVFASHSAVAQMPDHPADEPRMVQIPGDVNPTIAAGQELSKGEASLRTAAKSLAKAEEADGKKRDKLEAKAKNAYEEAEQHFMAALRYDAELLDAYVGLGRTWQATAQYEKAVSAWMEAAKRAPSADGEIIYGAASCLLNLDRPRDAASLYASLAEADPQRANQLIEELRVWGEAHSATGNEEADQLLAWIEQLGG